MIDWSAWPHSSSHQDQGANGHPSLGMILGRLLERTETHGEQLDRIETKLEAGALKFQEHSARIRKLEAREVSEKIPRWERNIKRWLTYLLPAGVAYGTGSIEGAIRLLEALR